VHQFVRILTQGNFDAGLAVIEQNPDTTNQSASFTQTQRATYASFLGHIMCMMTCMPQTCCWLVTPPYHLRSTPRYRQGTVDVKVYDVANNMRCVTYELDAKMRMPGHYPLRLVATELTTQNMVVLPRDAYLFYKVNHSNYLYITSACSPQCAWMWVRSSTHETC
jgi:hypothetical protein